MSDWIVKRTDTFLKYLKKHRNNHELLLELDKKIIRFKENPDSLGGDLAGSLHGHKNTRLSGKFRLVFSADYKNKIVYLEAIGHRKDLY